MEASEKPQQPSLEEQEGIVRALEDRIVIQDLTIADGDTARVVRNRAEAGEEPARTVRRTIEIGARVLDREDADVEVDFVRREYEHVMEEHRREAERLNHETVERIEGQMRQAFGDAAAKGALAEALESHAAEVADAIEQTFGEDSESGVPQRVQGLIEKRNREFLERLSADDELNPLRPLVSQFSSWVRERREEQDERDDKLEEKLDELLGKASELVGVQQAAEAIAEAEDAGTRKGRGFEDRVNDALERLADARGDAAFHVGDEPGRGGTKKGDTVVELEAAGGSALGRIVFEAKDKKLSKKEAWDELNDAMAEREAAFAVLVVAGEARIPSGREQLHEYEGNKLIVAVDADEPDGIGLELAYRYARCRSLLLREGELEMDAPAVRDAAAEALSALKQAQSIKLNLSKAESGIASARSGLEDMAEDVKQRLDRIESLVSGGE